MEEQRDGERERERERERVDCAKRGSWWLMSEGRRREKERRYRDGDGVLPGGRDEAMSTPQKQAGSWRPPQAVLQRENMGLSGVCQTLTSMLSVLWFCSTATCFSHPMDILWKTQSRLLNCCFDDSLTLIGFSFFSFPFSPHLLYPVVVFSVCFSQLF